MPISFATWVILSGFNATAVELSDDDTAPSSQEVEKQIVYQKDTMIDLSTSEVRGESKLPPAFFLMKADTPKAESLLAERLNFKLKQYNRTGF